MRKRSIPPRPSCLPNPIDLKSSGYLFAAAFDAVYTRVFTTTHTPNLLVSGAGMLG
jgi:hypothetical protein